MKASVLLGRPISTHYFPGIKSSETGLWIYVDDEDSAALLSSERPLGDVTTFLQHPDSRKFLFLLGFWLAATGCARSRSEAGWESLSHPATPALPASPTKVDGP